MNEANLKIFCAALQGYVANRHFHESVSQGEPQAAVAFARAVVRAAHNDNPASQEPMIT